MNEKELIEKIELLEEEKETQIKNCNYERAAQIRDEIRKFTAKLEDLMNE